MTPEELRKIHNHYIQAHFEAMEIFQQGYEGALEAREPFALTVRSARKALNESKELQRLKDNFDIIIEAL
jgi:hypothetical protein